MLETWHLNLEFNVATMDRVSRLVAEGWRSDQLAFELGIPEPRVEALLIRNGLPVHPRRKRK